jgi:regulatory protein YycH of two-component signal transduction system YycFG
MRNWEDVLPKNIAKIQHAWEKRMRVLIAKNAGAKFSEIAKRLNVSNERVRQMFFKAEEELRYKKKSPIEIYFNQFPWESDVTHWQEFCRTKKNFNETTKSGRRNLKNAATNFMMGRNP